MLSYGSLEPSSPPLSSIYIIPRDLLETLIPEKKNTNYRQNKRNMLPLPEERTRSSASCPGKGSPSLGLQTSPGREPKPCQRVLWEQAPIPQEKPPHHLPALGHVPTGDPHGDLRGQAAFFLSPVFSCFHWRCFWTHFSNRGWRSHWRELQPLHYGCSSLFSPLLLVVGSSLKVCELDFSCWRCATLL